MWYAHYFDCYLTPVAATEFVPTTWLGNYTCNDADMPRYLEMSLAQTSSILVSGDMVIDGVAVNVTGTFAEFFKTLTVQSNKPVAHEIFGGNITSIEVNCVLESPVLMRGAIILQDASTQDLRQCPVEFARKAGRDQKILDSVNNPNET